MAGKLPWPGVVEVMATSGVNGVEAIFEGVVDLPIGEVTQAGVFVGGDVCGIGGKGTDLELRSGSRASVAGKPLRVAWGVFSVVVAVRATDRGDKVLTACDLG